MIEFVWINAGIFLFTPSMGGKSWNVRNNYYPNLVWDFNSSINFLAKDGEFILEDSRRFNAKNTDGLFFLQEEEELGKFFHCKIRMSKEKWFQDYISEGKHFLIREGSKVIGIGVMLSKASAPEINK